MVSLWQYKCAEQSWVLQRSAIVQTYLIIRLNSHKLGFYTDALVPGALQEVPVLPVS